MIVFTFLSRRFGHVGKRFDKKAKVILKFMTSQTGQQIITIHLLPDISRNKDNKAMKFVQLIEYNVRKMLLQKVCTNEAERQVPKLLLFF